MIEYEVCDLLVFCSVILYLRKSAYHCFVGHLNNSKYDVQYG